jgi:DNA polymerase-3 subunit beta
MTTLSMTGADLASAASFAAALAPARTSSPELGAVVIEADAAGTATFSAYDHTTAGSVTIPAGDVEPGKLLVSARLLAAIAATTTREALVWLSTGATESVSIAGRGLAQVYAGRSKWGLPLLEARHYPQLPKPGEPVGTVDAAALAAALARVLPATGDPNTPPMFGGAALSGEVGGPLTLAGTDRWRLSAAEIDWTGITELPDTIVPKDALERMAFAARRQGEVALHVAKNGISLVGTDYWVHGPIIATPNSGQWRRVDMSDADAITTAVLELTDLKELVGRASALLDPRDALLLTIDPVGEVQLGLLDGNRGQVDHGWPATIVGDGGTVGVDGHYLRQGIDAIATPMIRLCLFEGRKRGLLLLLPLDEHGEQVPGFRHVVMAKRVMTGEDATRATVAA